MTPLGAACAALAGGGAPTPPWLADCGILGAELARRLADGQSVAQALNAALGFTAAGTDHGYRDDAHAAGGGRATRHATDRGGRRASAIPMPCGRDLRFVPHTELPAGEAYEAFIARTGCVPTRDNVHDLFNGLMWLRCAPLKRRLNTLHAAQIAQDGVGQTRGRVRDALTLFDENAALLQAPAVLADALRRRDWQALFVEHRAAWQHARLTLFGHALLEKLVAPRKAITAHVWLWPGPVNALADQLSPHWLAENGPHPLPVLGVPGWWPANADPAFYRDDAVFRPARPPRAEVRPTGSAGESCAAGAPGEPRHANNAGEARHAGAAGERCPAGSAGEARRAGAADEPGDADAAAEPCVAGVAGEPRHVDAAGEPRGSLNAGDRPHHSPRDRLPPQGRQ